MSHRSSLGHRAPFLWLLVPFAAGLSLGKVSPFALPVGLLLALALLVVVALVLTRATERLWGIGLSGALLCAGAAYYDIRRERQPEWDRLPMREAELLVRVDRLFAPGEDPLRFSGLGQVISAPPHLRELERQRIALSARRTASEVEPYRGVLVRLRGVLEPLPRRPPDDPFIAYLVDTGYNFRLGRGQTLSVVEPTGYAAGRERFRQRAVGWLGHGIAHLPEAVGALRGMLLGERGVLSDVQEDRYLRTGTLHLFAISGLHIAVIAGALAGALRLLPLPRFLHFLLSSTVLWLYVDLTGALPSAVRAWLMVVCLHASTLLRARGNHPSALTVSAVLVLLLDPMQLFGAGFQMSYGIVAALLLYGLPMAEDWARLSRPPGVELREQARPSFLRSRLETFRSSVAISVATGLVGVLSGVGFFGQFTPGGLIANLPLIPLAGLVILSGFASLVCGLCGIAPLVSLFNHGAALVLRVMEWLLAGFAGTPGFSSPAAFVLPALTSGSLVLLLGACLWGYSHGWKPERGGLWAPLVVTGLLLLATKPPG